MGAEGEIPGKEGGNQKAAHEYMTVFFPERDGGQIVHHKAAFFVCQGRSIEQGCGFRPGVDDARIRNVGTGNNMAGGVQRVAGLPGVVHRNTAPAVPYPQPAGSVRCESSVAGYIKTMLCGGFPANAAASVAGVFFPIGQRSKENHVVFAVPVR